MHAIMVMPLERHDPPCVKQPHSLPQIVSLIGTFARLTCQTPVVEAHINNLKGLKDACELEVATI